MSIILQDLSPSNVTSALDANHIAYYSLFRHHSQAIFHHDPEILWFETGIRHDIFNRILQTRLDSASAPATIERVSGHFQQHSIPFLWHLGPSSQPAHLGSLLESYGMLHYETEPGMAVDLLKVNEDFPTIAQLTVHPVTTEELLEQWIRVWEFESSEEVIRLWLTFYSKMCLDQESPLRLYLGMFNDEPVATSGVFFGGGVASIGPIGTLSQYRRQGIGTAMTIVALREARTHRYRLGVLTASSMGIEIYRRIGFQQYCTFSTYLWHPTY